MLGPPLLDALHVFGAAEVIPVLRLGQPAHLTAALAGELTLRGRTKLLALPIAVIGNKKLLTMRAFAASGQRLHRAKNPPAKSPLRQSQAGRKTRSQPDGRRREEEISVEPGKKTEPEEDNNINPADLPHFQTAADTHYQLLLVVPESAAFLLARWQDFSRLSEKAATAAHSRRSEWLLIGLQFHAFVRGGIGDCADSSLLDRGWCNPESERTCAGGA
jgi:hypothetical protein